MGVDALQALAKHTPAQLPEAAYAAHNGTGGIGGQEAVPDVVDACWPSMGPRIPRVDICLPSSRIPFGSCTYGKFGQSGLRRLRRTAQNPTRTCDSAHRTKDRGRGQEIWSSPCEGCGLGMRQGIDRQMHTVSVKRRADFGCWYALQRPVPLTTFSILLTIQ